MSKSKDKGRRHESEVARLLTEAGIAAERIPLSGSLGDKYSSDVVIGTPEQPSARIECKHRESMSMQLWTWLEGNDFLVIKRNNCGNLVVMDIDKFIGLIK